MSIHCSVTGLVMNSDTPVVLAIKVAGLRDIITIKGVYLEYSQMSVIQASELSYPEVEQLSEVVQVALSKLEEYVEQKALRVTQFFEEIDGIQELEALFMREDVYASAPPSMTVFDWLKKWGRHFRGPVPGSNDYSNVMSSVLLKISANAQYPFCYEFSKVSAEEDAQEVVDQFKVQLEDVAVHWLSAEYSGGQVVIRFQSNVAELEHHYAGVQSRVAGSMAHFYWDFV